MKSEKVTRLSDMIADFLANIPMFASLEPEEIPKVARHMSYMELDAGDTLFKEWDPGNYVCFIVYGALDVVKKAGPDKEVVLRTLNRGRSIGEMAIIENLPRSATVKAQSHSTLLLLSREDFENLLEESPKIGVKLLKGLACLLSDNLRKTSSRLADYMLPLG